MVTIVAGFLIFTGYLGGPVAYIVILVGDTIGDWLHYVVGSSLRHDKAAGVMNKLRIGPDKLAHIDKHFKNHPRKSLLVGKALHGVGGIIQVIAGMSRMPLWEFIWINFLGTVPKSLLLIFIGYNFGKYLPQIDKYFRLGGTVLFSISVSLIALYIIVPKILRNREFRKHEIKN